MRSLVFAVLALFAAPFAYAQSAFTVSPGDTLAIEVLEDPSLNRSAVVLPDGTINFPFAGSVRVAGRTVGQVETVLESGISSNFASTPNVFVTVSSLGERVAAPVAASTITVYLVGEVNAPGAQSVGRGTTFLQALALSGGLTPFAADSRIQLRRIDTRSGASELVTINYRALSRGADLSRDVVLTHGDVILVPSRGLFE